MTSKKTIAAALLCLAIVGCRKDAPPAGHAEHDPEPPPASNRIAVPPTVRSNLGITFINVEQRRVASTIRVPGQFELTPSARREYHTTLTGRVELLVNQYDPVQAGTPLYRVDSPQWRDMQQKLSETVNAVQQASAQTKSIGVRLAAVKRHGDRLREQEKIWSDRVGQLNVLIEAGGGAASELAEAQSQLSATRTSLAKVDEELAEVAQQRITIDSQLNGYRRSMPLLYADALSLKVNNTDARIDLALAPAAAMLGVPVDKLRENAGSADNPLPYWRTIDLVEFRAQEPGVVETLGATKGAWLDASALVLTTVDPRQIRFRAVGLQSDLGRLTDDLPARIVPPRGGAAALRGVIEGKLTLGLEADPNERKVDLIVTPQAGELPAWARRGMAAEMEVAIDQTADPQPAILTSAVIKDGLEKVIFRRDPKNPDMVIRMEADLGVSDGRWVVIESGLAAGDQVVHHGVYELMLSSGGGKAKGGHFHADGTFHEDDH